MWCMGWRPEQWKRQRKTLYTHVCTTDMRMINAMGAGCKHKRSQAQLGDTLECVINVPVRILISRKMPPYTGTIWHYTFILFLIKCMRLYILARQFLRKATNSPNLAVNKSWYLYNVSLGRLLEGDPLEYCLLIQPSGPGSDCASSHFAYNLWDLPPYRYSYLALSLSLVRWRYLRCCDFDVALYSVRPRCF